MREIDLDGRSSSGLGTSMKIRSRKTSNRLPLATVLWRVTSNDSDTCWDRHTKRYMAISLTLSIFRAYVTAERKACQIEDQIHHDDGNEGIA